MSDRDTAVLIDFVDVSLLEKENKELASNQVRQINDHLRKVRDISRESETLYAEEVQRSFREDATDRFFLSERVLESPVAEVFKQAFDMFESDCSQFNFTKGRNSPVVKVWKLV